MSDWIVVRSLAATILLLVSATAARGETIAVISDLNGRYGSTRYDTRVDSAITRIVELKPEVVVIAGDMIAGQRNPPLDREHLRAMWTSFHRKVTAPLDAAGIPVLVTPGNHDGSAYPDFAVERDLFIEEWRPRRPDLEFLAGDGYPLDYAVAVGDVLLIGLDVTRPSPLPGAQRQFLDSVLRQHGPQFTTRVVFCHLPQWPFAQGREREIVNDPRLEALLVEHDVDVLVSGHHHVFFAGIDSGGVLHVSVGALGGNARRFVDDGTRQTFSFVLIETRNGGVSVSARAAPDFRSPVDLTGLPEAINGPLGLLRRQDLAK
jgi:3',5'-cyclic AMP phosphodiesterase CpdA